MAIENCAISCGAIQLYRLSNYYNIERGRLREEPIEIEDLVQEVKNSKEFMKFGFKKIPFVIFSDNIIKSKAGISLAKYITDKKLGEITESPVRNNPGHDGAIRIWIWTVDWNNLVKWEK